MDPETALAFEMFIQQLPAANRNERQLNEPPVSSGHHHFVDPPWQLDGWSTAAPPSIITGGADGCTIANNLPEYYGQNYDFNSYYLPLDNHHHHHPPPFALQPSIPQVVPVVVPPTQLVFQPMHYVPSVRVPCGEREVYELPGAAGLPSSSSSVNGAVNGAMSQLLNPPFGWWVFGQCLHFKISFSNGSGRRETCRKFPFYEGIVHVCVCVCMYVMFRYLDYLMREKSWSCFE